MSDKAEEALQVLFAFLCKFVALPVGIVMWSWACWLTWGWFAPVVSASLPILTFAQCIALRALLAPWRASTSDATKERTTAEHVKAAFWGLFLQVFAPLMTVAIALPIHWMIHLSAEVKP